MIERDADGTYRVTDAVALRTALRRLGWRERPPATPGEEARFTLTMRFDTGMSLLRTGEIRPFGRDAADDLDWLLENAARGG